VLNASFDSRNPEPTWRCDLGPRREKSDFLRDSGIGGVISLFGITNIQNVLMMTTKGEPVPMIVHPALTKYLLKLEVGDSVDPDYDLPGEELTSPAVHPPVPWLELENCEGYPQHINIQASGNSPDVGVTVQDVLRAIHEDMRKPSTRPAWDRLRNDERTWIKTSFKKRCKTEEELSKGLHRIDYLCGRDRLQIFPKLSPDGVQFSPPMPMSEDSP
jgi:hypothetical protein